MIENLQIKNSLNEINSNGFTIDNINSSKIVTGYPHIDKPWMQFFDKEIVNRKDPKVNLTEYLKIKTKKLDFAIASSYYGKQTTYNEFWIKVDNASRVLEQLGVKKQDRIMFLVPNIPESGELWLGATQIGIISDFIDPRPDSMDIKANSKKVLELIKYEKASQIVALDKCYLTMLKPIENELKELGIEKIITLSALNSMNMKGIMSYFSDIFNYNKLRNMKVNSFQKSLWYKILIEKIKEIKKDKILYGDFVKKSPLEIVSYAELLKDVKYCNFTSVYEENLINYIGHTSGTSGSRPKPICLTNENHIASTEQLFKANANFNVGDKVLHILPFFSPLGADNNFVLNLASGSMNIDVPEFEISEFGYLIKKYHPNVILGTPSWIASLTKSQYLQNEDLSCIERIIYGGDSMTREDEEKLNIWLKNHASNAVVEKGHGMSEYCGCGSYAQDGYNKYESIGIPLPNTIYTIVNPDVDDYLEPLQFREDEERLKGELVVSSNAVTAGMLDTEIIVPHYELDGQSYIRTRDLVEMDRDGIFYFNARKDRSFTRFDGYKIKPYEIEKEIEQNELVEYCRIVPYFDDDKKGLMPKAHIVLANENIDDYVRLTEQILKAQIIDNSEMSSRQIPAKVKYRKSLPLTANSKVNYRALIEEGLDGTEILIDVEETNLSVGKIQVFAPIDKSDVKKLVKKK